MYYEKVNHPPNKQKKNRKTYQFTFEKYPELWKKEQGEQPQKDEAEAVS